MPLSVASWASAYCVLPFVLSQVNNVPGTELSYIAQDDDCKHHLKKQQKNQINLRLQALEQTEKKNKQPDSWKMKKERFNWAVLQRRKHPYVTQLLFPFCSTPWCGR